MPLRRAADHWLEEQAQHPAQRHRQKKFACKIKSVKHSQKKQAEYRESRDTKRLPDGLQFWHVVPPMRCICFGFHPLLRKLETAGKQPKPSPKREAGYRHWTPAPFFRVFPITLPRLKWKD